MPQLDPSSFASQIFWLIVVFSALYFVLARYTLPRIREVMEKRQNQIQHDLDSAQKARDEAASAKQSYESDLASAKEKANSLLADTQREIDAMVADELGKLNDQLEDLMVDSEQKIAAQREEAFASVTPMIAKLAAEVMHKLGGSKPDAASLEASVRTKMES